MSVTAWIRLVGFVAVAIGLAACRPETPSSAPEAVESVPTTEALQPEPDRGVQQTGRRLALVIGNDSYAAAGSNLSTLQQARSDAGGVTSALVDVGFEVETVEDADLGELQEALVRFRGRLEAGPGEVALIYFAGHGLQHTSADAQGQTVQQPWLLPVDAKIEKPWDIESRGVPLGRVRSLLANSGFKANVIVLDMCRNEVFAGGAPPTGYRSSWVRGLAPVSSSDGLLVAYATAAGDVAREIPGQPNSVYATALIEQLRAPGQHLYDVFNNAALAVAREGVQKPELMVSALEPVYLKSSPAGTISPEHARYSVRKVDEANEQRLSLSIDAPWVSADGTSLSLQQEWDPEKEAYEGGISARLDDGPEYVIPSTGDTNSDIRVCVDSSDGKVRLLVHSASGGNADAPRIQMFRVEPSLHSLVAAIPPIRGWSEASDFLACEEELAGAGPWFGLMGPAPREWSLDSPIENATPCRCNIGNLALLSRIEEWLSGLHLDHSWLDDLRLNQAYAAGEPSAPIQVELPFGEWESIATQIDGATDSAGWGRPTRPRQPVLGGEV